MTADLIARLIAGPGSRELDAEIMAILHFKDERHIGEQLEDMRKVDVWRHVKSSVWVSKATGKWVSTQPHYYTASIDAATGFAVAVLGEVDAAMAFVHAYEGALEASGATWRAALPRYIVAEVLIVAEFLKARGDD